MNLSTRYMGLHLKHPIVPSASPLSGDLERIRQLEDAGAAAIVLPSLFEEQLERKSRALPHYLDYGAYSYAEALDYFPDMKGYNVGSDGYLQLIHKASEAVDIPVIASLNGISSGGWTEYAKLIQEAGADALELNIYYLPTDLSTSGSEVESMYTDIVRAVKAQVTIPVAVKLSPYFSALPNMSVRLVHAGADALVLFNRFYQPDIDLEALEVTPHLVLSNPHELRLPLRWLAILYGRVQTDFAVTSGIHSHEEVLKAIMAGANVTMMASELLKNGIGRIGEILNSVVNWMDYHEYESVEGMRGNMSLMNVKNADAFERANYMRVLQSYRPDPSGQFR